MHRSGTSCLTGCLQSAGLYLGDVNIEARYNRRGNRENKRIWQLNDAVLAHNGGTWLSPPEQTLTWTDEHRRMRDDILRDYQHREKWGFKDPRVLFTVDGWLEVLDSIEFVGSYRHPASVVRSLMSRWQRPPTIEDSLALWLMYNQRLVALWERCQFPLISFDLDRSEYLNKLSDVCESLGLATGNSSHAFFDAGLRHQSSRLPADHENLPVDVLQLYRRLKQISAL